MKTKLELIEFSMYENDELENYLHEKAKQGWMIKEITRFIIIYEKCEPKDCYFKVDYIDRKNAFTTHKSGKILDYEQFLESYDCHHICGNGYRQIIQMPSKDFVFHTDEIEKEAFQKKIAKKDFIYTLLIWMFYFVSMIIGMINGRLWKENIYFDIAILCIVATMFMVVIYPHLKRKALNIKVRKYFLIFMVSVCTLAFILNIVAFNSVQYLFYWLFLSGVIITLIYILEKTKIIKPVNQNYVSKTLIILFGIMIGTVLYVGDKDFPPAPKMPSVWEVRIKAPFTLQDENAISNYKYENNQLGEGKRTEFIHIKLNRYMSYTTYQLKAEEPLKVIAQYMQMSDDDLSVEHNGKVSIIKNDNKIKLDAEQKEYTCNQIILLYQKEVVEILDSNLITNDKIEDYIKQLGWDL